MLIRFSDWELARDKFSESERDQLNSAITGEAICPRGAIVDPAKLTPSLRRKLLDTVPGLEKHREARG